MTVEAEFESVDRNVVIESVIGFVDFERMSEVVVVLLEVSNVEGLNNEQFKLP